MIRPEGYLYTSSGIPTDEKKVRMADRLETLPPRIGRDRLPVWCSFYPESNSIFLPFQIRSEDPYPLKALIGFGANYRMWPGSDFLKESLLKLDLLVFADFFMTDTCEFGDILLPAATHFERSELKHWDAHYLMLTEPAIQPPGRGLVGCQDHHGTRGDAWDSGTNSGMEILMPPSTRS